MQLCRTSGNGCLKKRSKVWQEKYEPKNWPVAWIPGQRSGQRPLSGSQTCWRLTRNLPSHSWESTVQFNRSWGTAGNSNTSPLTRNPNGQEVECHDAWFRLRCVCKLLESLFQTSGSQIPMGIIWPSKKMFLRFSAWIASGKHCLDLRRPSWLRCFDACMKLLMKGVDHECFSIKF